VQVLGAAMGLGVIGRAIFLHLFTPIAAETALPSRAARPAA